MIWSLSHQHTPLIDHQRDGEPAIYPVRARATRLDRIKNVRVEVPCRRVARSRPPIERFPAACREAGRRDVRARLMKKDITGLPSDVQAQIKALEALPGDEIDTIDAPEIIDWPDARSGVFYRPVK